MSRIARGAAVFASVAALGAAAAAPANAQDITLDSGEAICGGHITVPCLVDATFAVVDYGVHAAHATVQNTLNEVDKVVYLVCDIVTGDCEP